MHGHKASFAMQLWGGISQSHTSSKPRMTECNFRTIALSLQTQIDDLFAGALVSLTSGMIQCRAPTVHVKLPYTSHTTARTAIPNTLLLIGD